MVLPQPAINPVLAAIGRLDVAAEIAAVDLGPLALATDRGLSDLGGERFPDLVRQHEGGLVLRPEIAAERQHALALDLVDEDRYGHEVGPQGHLVEREQCAARHAEILAAGFAAPARRAVRAAGHVDGRATAMRAGGIAAIARPTEADEDPLDFLIAHAHDGRQRERPGGCGEEEVLGHLRYTVCFCGIP